MKCGSVERYKTDAGSYIIFCKVINEQTKQYGMTRKAVTETIRICKDNAKKWENFGRRNTKFFPKLTLEDAKELEAEIMQLA